MSLHVEIVTVTIPVLQLNKIRLVYIHNEQQLNQSKGYSTCFPILEMCIMVVVVDRAHSKQPVYLSCTNCWFS